MPDGTHTVTINAAFLQEIKDEDEQLKSLLQRAREMCESVPLTPVPASDFVSLLVELRDQLAVHFALEEAYGYFDDPVSVAPHLSEQAETLRGQHSQLHEEISLLAKTAQDISRCNGDPRGIQQVADGFLQFNSRLQEHEEGENKLIMQAYSLDIGGSG